MRVPILLIVLFAAVAASADDAPMTIELPRLQIRLYAEPPLTAVELRHLQVVIDRVFTQVMSIEWLVCGVRGQQWSPACDRPLGPAAIGVRMLSGASPQDPSTLGTAVVGDPGDGVLATVYLGAVRRVASASAVDPGVLIGEVTAHEVTHLVLGRGAHCHSGLMRPSWSLAELREPRSLSLTAAQRRQFARAADRRMQGDALAAEMTSDQRLPIAKPTRRGTAGQ